MRKFRTKFLMGTMLSSLCLFAALPIAVAEDCTTTLPGANCTLDEDTTAPLTIDNGITLTVGSSVLIDHEIDGDDLLGDGTITTVGGPNTITQNADIGATIPINVLNINDDNTWTTSAAINTDSTGSDINLSVADGGETLNFNDGGSYSGEIDGHVGDTVNFGADGNGGSFVTGGQIETVRVVLTSGSLQVNNTIGGGIALGDFTVADGATVNTQANITTAGAFNLDGQITIGAGNTVFANSYTADADTGTIILEVSRDLGITSNGRLNVSSGGPLDLSNDILEIIVSSSTEGLVDQTIASAIVGNTAATIAPGQFIDNSFLYDFTLVPNGNNLDLVITVHSIANSANTANNLAIANAILGTLADVDSAALKQIQSSLGTASSQADFNAVLDSIQPTVDGGYAMASLAVKDEVNHAINKRVDTLFQQRAFPQQKTRMISGGRNLKTGRTSSSAVADVLNEPKGAVWAHGFAQSGTQSSKDGIGGYDAGTAGIILGADSGTMRDDSLFGMTFVAATSDIESDNANATTTDVDTYGVSAFGGMKLSDKTLISGAINYAHGDNTSKRTQIAGVVGNNATGNFSTQHLGLHSKIAHQYKTKGNWTFTPSASVDYDYLFANSFTEESAVESAMNVDYSALNMLAFGVGMDVDYLYKSINGIRINPSAHARYKYDVLNQGIKSTASFIAAPDTRITTKGYEPQRSMLNLGGDIEAELSDDWRLAMGYELELKKDYSAHTGYLNALRKFQ